MIIFKNKKVVGFGEKIVEVIKVDIEIFVNKFV